MVRRMMVMAVVVLTAAGFSSGCSVLRPAMNAAGEEAQAWWNEKGKAQVEQMAKEAAGKAADGALEAAKTWATQKVEDNNKRLEAAGINPAEITGIKTAATKAAEYVEKQQATGKEIDWNILISIFGAGLAAYTTGSVGKGALRRYSQRGTALKDAPPLKT